MKVRAALPCLLLLGTALSTVARAEVAALVDRSGRYQCMSYKYSVTGGAPRIWAPSNFRSQQVALNPTGDMLGDLAPSVIGGPEMSSG